MARPFAKLRAAMLEHGDDQTALAVCLNISPSCVSDRFTCRYAWRLDEMYILLNRYGAPHEKLSEYFPMNGQNERGVLRPMKQRQKRPYQRAKAGAG